MKPRVGKYNASPQVYDGNRYHSRKEARHAAFLDLQRKSHDPEQRVVEWRRQVKTPLVVNGKHICNWYVDFEVTYADGRCELHEVKGYATEVYLMKRKLFEALYPERTLRVFR